jgi:hypothetical protein
MWGYEMAGQYTRRSFQTDLFHAMQSRPGKYSGRALGNTANVALWTADKVDSLWDGVVTAHRLFFRKECPSLRSFARLIICEGMQESTGIWNLGCKPVDFGDHTSHGFMQVTPGSVMKDYRDWGLPIRSARGGTSRVLLDPATIGTVDTSVPHVSVLLFAWYSKNCVNMGVSMNEYAHRFSWNIPITTTHQKVLGACQAVWLAGPRTYINTDAGWRAYDDYYHRILDYYTQSGFGDKASFDRHVYTPLVNEFLFVQRRLVDGI